MLNKNFMKCNTNSRPEDGSRAVSRNFTDAELQAAGFEAIQWLTTVPPETVRINVQDGWINLEGTVESWHQRDTLGDILRHVPGVKGLSNYLTLKPEAMAA